MPQRLKKAMQTYIEKSLKEAKKLEQKEIYSFASKAYEYLLRLQPDSLPISTRYSACLFKLNEVDKACMVLDQALKKNPSSIQTYQLYIKMLNKFEKFEKVKLVIKRAQNINQECRKSTKLCASYAQVCHRSQTFKDGIEMLKWYESMYKDLTLKTEGILIWRIYLCYQMGEYQQAVDYSDIILKLPNLKDDDIWYYRFQKCKYWALLGNYKKTLELADMILTQSNRDKSKLKVYAIKAYCLLYNNQIQEGAALLELALKENPNDFMLQLKWSLFGLMTLRNQSEKLTLLQKLKSNHLKERMKYVVKKMDECNKAGFDNSVFSQHYNWYSELMEYKENLKHLLQFLDEPDISKSIGQVIDFAELLFLNLMQGYDDWKKTNEKLSAIVWRIKKTWNPQPEAEGMQLTEK